MQRTPIVAVWMTGLLSLGASMGLAPSASAQMLEKDCEVFQWPKLTAADAAVGDEFGLSVSISSDTVVIGAKGNDDGGGNSGSAYIFAPAGAGWMQQAKLSAADAAAGDSFGISVSISGDTAVIGAPGDSVESGSAYVFVHAGLGWMQQAKLIAADAASEDRFGQSVSISGDTAIVGAPGNDDAGLGSGSAYIFVRSGGLWMQQAKLTAADAAASDQFGGSVSINSDTALVGAFQDDGQSGSAYVFVRTAGMWTQQAKLTTADAAPEDRFGWSVSISGDTALIGAPASPFFGIGSAYAFFRAGRVWTQQAELIGADTAPGEVFGNSVAISGDTALVGAHQDSDAGTWSGSAYVFLRASRVWTQQAKLTAADAAAFDAFGSVSISGDTALIGANGDDSSSGSGYVFDLKCPPFTGNLNGDLDVDGFDLAMLLAAWGPCPRGNACPADLDGNGIVNGLDLAILLASWS